SGVPILRYGFYGRDGCTKLNGLCHKKGYNFDIPRVLHEAPDSSKMYFGEDDSISRFLFADLPAAPLRKFNLHYAKECVWERSIIESTEKYGSYGDAAIVYIFRYGPKRTPYILINSDWC